MKNIIPALLLSFLTSTAGEIIAQSDTDILLTINQEEITAGEFKRVYLKNLELVQDDSQKDVTSYLELFKEYKLKVQEAYALGLDQKESYIKELEGYKRQLSRNFLTDISVTDALVEEAYNRLQEEVNARHILVKIEGGATPEDTLAAYNTIMEARDLISDGKDFNAIARKYSTDPSAKRNGGELGWFKAFKMVYPFESAAYNTKVGDVSMPFRTRFGYHIVQPTARRKAEGEVTAAHIMIALKQQDSTVNPEKRIKEIYTLLQQGEAFETLAKKYSDDKKTGRKGGLLSPFSKGQLSSEVFENEVFALSEDGATTQPFKTDFGWHIAKRIGRKPIGTYEQERYALENKVKKDSRAQIISDSLVVRLCKQYNVSENPEVVGFFKEIVTDEVFKRQWKFDTLLPNLDKTVFTLRDNVYTYKDVGSYIEQSQSKAYGSKDAFVTTQINEFYSATIRKYHQDNLEFEDPDFAAVYREYKEGLLLFDLMETYVWNQAKNDTLGLQRFYDNNKSNYQWPARAEVIIASAKDKGAIEAARSLSLKGLSSDEIATQLNSKKNLKVFFTKKTVPLDDSVFVKNYTVKEGVSDIHMEDGYIYYNVLNVLPESIKTLDEARGIVSSDFQKEIEQKWVQSLRNKASIKVNKKTLKKLTKTLQSK